MQLPQLVEDALNAQGISYSLVEIPKSGPSPGRGEIAHSVVLSDPNGRIQAIVPSDCLLDLAALKRFTGREFIAAADVAASPTGMQSVAVMPSMLDLPMVVDRRLLDSDHVVLRTGDNETLLHLAREHFQRLLSGNGAAIGNFTVHLSELAAPRHDDSADAADIGNAVSKFTTRRIEKRLEDTLDFPPLPEIAHRIIQIGADPYASVKDLARVVEVDPSLSAQVVSWASSPYYAAPGKVKSIQDAILRVLGFDMVMNLALGLALGKTMRLPREGRYGYRNYWLQSVYCAAMMEGVCKSMPSGKRPALGIAYLSGLLHNFGFLILAELFKPQLQLVCRYAEANPHIGHSAVERFLLGVTREQMGAWLMKFWHLPEEVCAALRFQNEPELAGDHETLALALNLSVRLLAEQGIGSAPAERIPDELFQQLGISRSDADAVWERINSSTEDLKLIARDLAA